MDLPATPSTSDGPGLPLGAGLPSRLLRALLAGHALAAVLLVLGTSINLVDDRDTELSRLRESADNIAHGLSVELGAQFQLVDNALNTLALRHAEPVSEAQRQRQLRLGLQQQAALLPFASALRVADTEGQVRLGLARGELPFSIAARAYFEQARRARGTVVSEPVFSSVLQDDCLIVARALRDELGEFRGVVYAVLAARQFQARFAALALGGDGAVALRAEGQRLVARHPTALPEEGALVEPLSKELARGAAQGWLPAATGADGVERLVAYRRVPGQPLVVLAGLGTAGYRAHLATERRRQWFFAALVLLLVSGGLGLVLVQHRRQYLARVQASRQAREQALLLNNDLVGMVRVEGRRILWANRALHRILGHEEGLLAGLSMRALYPDDASFERVGRLGYDALRRDGRFHAQLQMCRRDGRPLWVDLSAAALSDSEFLWMVVDIDQLKSSEEAARHLALHDGLTGLANRRLFEELLQQAAAQAQRQQQGLSVCYLDLDGFKPINDQHGHEAGDEVLREVAQRLRSELRDNDSVARLGGDEFAWLLAGVHDAAQARAVAARCVERIRLPIQLASGAWVSVSASVGIACSARHGHAAQELLQAADAAMYGAKRAGRQPILPAQRAQLVAIRPTVTTASSVA